MLGNSTAKGEEKSEGFDGMMFDLRKLQALANRVKPPSVIILDTSIILDAPPIVEWKVPIDNVVYVVTDVLVDQLVHLSESKDIHKAYLARQAKKSVDELLDKWNNDDKDIFYLGIGYFVKVISPDHKILDAEFRKSPRPAGIIGESDMTLLFLARECNELIPHVRTMLGTADKDLSRIAGIRGVPFYLFDKAKPWESLSQILKTIDPYMEPIDWAAEIEEIAKSKTHVGLMLNGVSPISTSGPDAQTLRIATGRGLLIHWGEEYSFTWSLQYQIYNIFSMLHQLDSVPTIEFDSHAQNLPDIVINRLYSQLGLYANVELWESETLQEPDSIMLQLLYFDYLRVTIMNRDESYLGEIYEFEKSLSAETKKAYRRAFAQHKLDKQGSNKIGKMDVADFARDWILDVQNWSTDAYITYHELFSSLFNHWEVGNSIEFDFYLSDDVVV